MSYPSAGSISKATGSSSALKGTGYKALQQQQFTPEQAQLFQSLFSHVGGNSSLSKLAGGDQSEFGALEAPALRQFQELQGGLASRFSSLGSGARKGSGFQKASNQATADFTQQLQSQRLGIRNQALRDLFSMSNELFGQRPQENIFLEKEQKKGGILSSLLNFGGAAAGGYLGGPGGAAVGSKLGTFLSGLGKKKQDTDDFSGFM